MITTTQALRAVLRASPSAWVAALVLGMAGALVACGGGGTVPATQPGGLRPLSAEFSTRKAVNYSPYRSDNRDTEVVTRENVLQDLGLLAQGGFTLIRTFDSSDEFARLMLQIIKDNQINMKVQLGIYIAPTNGTGTVLASALQFNSAEVARGIRLANDFKDIVIAVSVGNESVAFGNNTPQVMAGYLTTVRGGVTQPLTTNDVWDAYAGLPGNGGAGMPAFVTNLIDFAAVHTYPILYASSGYYDPWDWEQQAVPEAGRAAAMMDAAVERVKVNYAAVRKYLDSQGHRDLPIVIGEAGWKAVPTGDLAFLAHPANQKMFYDRLLAWGESSKTSGGPLAIFYFEAFDEPWKAVANPAFNDDGWGLFNVSRQARFVVQSLYAASQWAPGSFTLADAVYAPTVVSSVISANRYTVYADAVTAGEAIAPAAQWFGFDSPPNAFAGEGSDATLAAEGLHFMEIGPAPSTAVGKDYGWGALTVTNPARVDLSQFQATGRLNFSVKTTYPGKLMFGFGTPVAGAVFVVASNTNADGYGYVNDGSWHQVSIPVSAFTAAGGKFDLTKVTNTLVVADIYDKTGNAKGSTTKVFIDAVYWSK
jgi:exo-beta-1,3-glucanase (GH17 family)